jgi:ubiquinone/menaquinone biosynthesis methyltransferase
MACHMKSNLTGTRVSYSFADVKKIFSRVSPYYTLMNDWMSLGQHRLWKQTFVQKIVEGSVYTSHRSLNILDIAAGTGDMGAHMAQHLSKRGVVYNLTLTDVNNHMLYQGQAQHLEKTWTWTCADARDLPFKEGEFDLVTIAFGLRNIKPLQSVLREVYRVLRPGGTFYCLEFSQPTNPWIEAFYQLYSQTWIPFVARQVGDGPSYQYLLESIREFPKADILKDMFKAFGFEDVTWDELCQGVIVMHQGKKAEASDTTYPC